MSVIYYIISSWSLDDVTMRWAEETNIMTTACWIWLLQGSLFGENIGTMCGEWIPMSYYNMVLVQWYKADLHYESVNNQQSILVKSE